MDYTELVLLFFISVVANWFSALAGGGAGLIQLPILIFMGLLMINVGLDEVSNPRLRKASK